MGGDLSWIFESQQIKSSNYATMGKKYARLFGFLHQFSYFSARYILRRPHTNPKETCSSVYGIEARTNAKPAFCQILANKSQNMLGRMDGGRPALHQHTNSQ